MEKNGRDHGLSKKFGLSLGEDALALVALALAGKLDARAWRHDSPVGVTRADHGRLGGLDTLVARGGVA